MANDTVSSTKATRARELSTIAFPYVDLETATAVAAAILAGGGVALSRDQMAAQMGTTSSSGTFLMKLSAARMFGLVQSAPQSKFELTDLGFAILDEKDPARQKAAKAEAFLQVPLYAKTFEEFKSRQLPPRPEGLETTLVRFGVAPKQKANARLAFDRSAGQAGFFPSGPDRLIEPIIGATVSKSKPDQYVKDAQPATARAPVPEAMGPGASDPLIQGLLKRLPEPGKPWPEAGRVKWLQAAAHIFDLMYTGDADITIETEQRDGPKGGAYGDEETDD